MTPARLVVVWVLVLLGVALVIALIGQQLVHRPTRATAERMTQIISEIEAAAFSHDGWEQIEGLPPDERSAIRDEILAAIRRRFGEQPEDGWSRPFVIQVLDDGRRYALRSSGVSALDPTDDLVVSDPPR